MKKDKQRDMSVSAAPRIDYTLSSLRYRPVLPTCCISHGRLHCCTAAGCEEGKAPKSSRKRCEMRHMFIGAQRWTRLTNPESFTPRRAANVTTGSRHLAHEIIQAHKKQVASICLSHLNLDSDFKYVVAQHFLAISRRSKNEHPASASAASE